MSKGLEALLDLLNGIHKIQNYYVISKELKALEIIKKKLVNLFHLAYTDTKEAYNDLVSEHYRELTQEEYDFLKEVLL